MNILSVKICVFDKNKSMELSTSEKSHSQQYVNCYGTSLYWLFYGPVVQMNTS